MDMYSCQRTITFKSNDLIDNSNSSPQFQYDSSDSKMFIKKNSVNKPLVSVQELVFRRIATILGLDEVTMNAVLRLYTPQMLFHLLPVDLISCEELNEGNASDGGIEQFPRRDRLTLRGVNNIYQVSIMMYPAPHERHSWLLSIPENELLAQSDIRRALSKPVILFDPPSSTEHKNSRFEPDVSTNDPGGFIQQVTNSNSPTSCDFVSIFDLVLFLVGLQG